MVISVLMPTYNSGSYIAQTIERVLNKSYTDFEFIIVDYGSIDNTKNIIHTYTDSRIIFIEYKHDFINSQNKGLNVAKCKYIARMNVDETMHIDRLKIQYAIMGEEKNIAVCGTDIISFTNNTKSSRNNCITIGLVINSLLYFIYNNIISHQAIMMCVYFINNNKLNIKNFPYSEDCKNGHE